MASRRASLVAQFGAKTHKYNRAILKAIKKNKEFVKSTKEMTEASKDNASSWALMITGVNQFLAIVKKVTDKIKRLVSVMLEWSKASSRLEEIQQKFNIVFRDSRTVTEEWSEQFAKSINRNATNVKDYAAQLQNTFVPLGFMREESTKLSKALVELAFDLSSFNDIPTDRVAKDLQAALLGNVRAVRKYGISANETAIAQEALNKGWVEEKSEIDGVIKARAINNIILRATSDAQGDMSRTLHQTANVRREYNGTIQRSKELLGDYVNDFLTPLRSWLSKIITGWNEAADAKRNYDRAQAGKFENTTFINAVEIQQQLVDNQKESIRLLEIEMQRRISASSGMEKNISNLVEQKQIKEFLLNQLESELLFLKEQQRIQEELEAIQRGKSALQDKQKVADEAQAKLDIFRTTILAEIRKGLEEVENKRQQSIRTLEDFNEVQEKSKVISEALNKVASDGADDAVDFGNMIIDQYGILIEDERVRIQIQEAFNELVKLNEEERLARWKEINDEIEETIRLQDKMAENLADTINEGIQANIDKVTEFKEAYEDMLSNLPGQFADVFSQISSLTQAIASREMDLFIFNNEEQQKIRDKAFDDKVAKLEKELTDKGDFNNAVLALEEERSKEEADIAEDLEQQKRRMQFDSALEAWNLKLLSSIASGAQAIISATASGFEAGGLPLAIIQAALATAMTGLQIATVSASRPVKNFRTGTDGFKVPEGFPNDSFNVGVSSGERLNVDTPTQQIGLNDIGTPLSVALIMNDTEVGRVVTRVFRNRDAIVRVEDLV